MWFLLSSMASAGSLPAIDWDWSHPRRYLLESEVSLPTALLFPGELNNQVRVMAFQLQAVTTCQGTDRYPPARKDEVVCRIDQVSLRAGTHQGDRGRGGEIVRQFHDALSGTHAYLVVHADGRLLGLQLPEIAAPNIRVRRRNEIVRQVVRFAFLGFELPMEHKGETTWVTNRSAFCTLPTARGVNAPVDAVHRGVVREGGVVELAGHARGTIQAADSPNTYTCEVTSRAFVDAQGLLKQTWEMLGEPTAGSLVNLGGAGYPYTQRGGLTRLRDDEEVDLPPSEEILVANRQSPLVPKGFR